MSDEYHDELPEELNAGGYVGPYQFPNNNRRRISAAILGAAGVTCLILFAVGGSDAVLVNRGFLYGGLFFLALAAYHLASGVTLRVNETDALIAATRAV